MGSSCSSIEHFDQGNIASGTNSVSSLMTVQLDPIAPMQGLTPSAISPLLAGTNVRSLPKKPFVGQKKPFSVLGVPSPVASKKQKLTESFAEQSIEQLNDVTAVSGVNLREEEVQLLSMPKKENDVWEATRRRLVLEEEEKLILRKLPLQIKLAMIALKCGIKNIGNDVEHCLSLCVEERMRDLIGNLIRLSKQRVDVERLRYSVLVTSDVQRQIQLLNQKAKCEEVVKPPKIDKINNYENDSMQAVAANKAAQVAMRAAAANTAARVAFGGGDMQLKWQNMAERARKKCDTESSGYSADAASAPSLSGSARSVGRNQMDAPPAKVSRTISIKDLIAALEREPQMSKSTLLYCLYEQMRKNAAAE